MTPRGEAGNLFTRLVEQAIRRLDERRVLWAAGDIVENRPALLRWHPDYKQAFERFLAE